MRGTARGETAVVDEWTAGRERPVASLSVLTILGKESKRGAI